MVRDQDRKKRAGQRERQTVRQGDGHSGRQTDNQTDRKGKDTQLLREVA